MSKNDKGQGVGEAELPQAPSSSPVCQQGSLGNLPEMVGQTAVSEAASPTSNQDAIVIHTTEDELRSIK